MQSAFLLAGTNLGDRNSNLDFALRSLENSGSLRAISSRFETEPVGYREQPWFLNQAVELETALTPFELLSLCQHIEFSCGRVRTFPDAPRTLDLDIVFFGNMVIREENLIIPHPRIAERRFVLTPLAQIAPEFIHPVLKKTVQALLENCPDSSEVRIHRRHPD